MSEYIEFFVAPNDASAARARTRGPRSSVTTVSGSYFDADDAVIAWENLLTGRVDPTAATLDEPRMVADYVNDGSGVFVLSEELVRSLARAEPGRLQQIAQQWLIDEAGSGYEVEPDAAFNILIGLADLARDSIVAGRRLYCWVSG